MTTIPEKNYPLGQLPLGHIHHKTITHVRKLPNTQETRFSFIRAFVRKFVKYVKFRFNRKKRRDIHIYLKYHIIRLQ